MSRIIVSVFVEVVFCLFSHGPPLLKRGVKGGHRKPGQICRPRMERKLKLTGTVCVKILPQLCV